MNEEAEIKKELIKMFKADESYGCGFYGDDDWMRAYGRLQYLAGFKGSTSVFDTVCDDFEDLNKESK